MKFKRATFVALIALALSVPSLRAAEDPAVAALKVADDTRVSATLAADPAKLTPLLSDDLRYAHSTGGVDTKASLIESLTTGKLKYAEFQYQERNFSLVSPTVAIMTGKTKIKTGSEKTSSEAVLGFLAVWRLEEGHWRFFAWQSCKLPPASAPAK